MSELYSIPSLITGQRKFFNLNKIGIPLGFVSINDIDMLLLNNSQAYIISESYLNVDTTASHNVIVNLRRNILEREEGFLVGAAHCQDGQGGPIRNLIKAKLI
jgi:hypothetical protein